jgi:hypothetical protein
MRFEEFRMTLDEDARSGLDDEWRKCLGLFRAAAGIHWQFVINLEAERRLPESGWATLCQVILQGTSQVSDLQRVLTDAFRSYIRKGPVVGLPKSVPLGRAITREIFLELLRRQFTFNSDDEKDQFVEDLLAPDASVDAIREILEDKELGRYLMWATFDLGSDGEPSGRDPFYSMPPDAEGIAARLGLSPNYKGQDLFLAIYKLPANVSAQYPTIADAYSDNDWPYYFRPSPDGERWGTTMPWDGGLTPCAEVVHDVVKGGQICDKIRVVTG